MPKCEMTITFDRPDRTYRFGDVISGAVEVSVTSPCQCRDLVLEQWWLAYGNGDSESDRYDCQTLFVGTWQPSQIYRYPFHFTAPNGPATYSGKFLNVMWYLRATAKVPLRRASKVQEDFVLVPPASTSGDGFGEGSSRDDETAREYYLGPMLKVPIAEQVNERIVPATHTLVCGVLLLVLGLLSVVLQQVDPGNLVAMLRLRTPPSSDLRCFFVGLGFVLIPFIIYYRVLTSPIAVQAQVLTRLRPRWLAVFSASNTALLLVGLFVLWMTGTIILGGGSLVLFCSYLILWGIRWRKVGPVTIQIWPAVAERGSTITCAVRLWRPPTGVSSAVEATLTGEEIVADGFYSRVKKTHKHVVYQNMILIMPDRYKGDREGDAFEARLAVPSNAPLSFWSPSNKLDWYFTVRVADWAPSYPIVVIP